MPGDAAPALETLAPDPWSLPIETLDVARAELFQQDVHGEYFRRLRQEDPVHYCPQSQFGPYWSLTRFKDIVEAEVNHKVFSSHRDIVIGDQEEAFYAPMFIASDPPVHDVQRKAAQPAVAPQNLSELEGLIRQRVRAIVDSLPVGETFNWVELVSKELTTQMLATLFDFPFEDRHLLPYWSDVTTDVPSVGVPGTSFEKRHEIMMGCLNYFAGLWQERAKAPPKFDFISLLAHNPQTRDMIDNPMELLGNLMLLIVGGNDTTRNSISGGVVALNRNPGEYAKLRANPGLVTSMVSEIIRWQTPLSHMRRTATEDIVFKGKHIRKGDKVILWYCSGNRDETEIPDADRFIIDRPQARHHIAFGFGIHRCMGNRVAEMQLRLLWEELIARFHNIEMVGEPTKVLSNFVNGYSSVPVVLHAR
jgi:cytochrome P450